MAGPNLSENPLIVFIVPRTTYYYSSSFSSYIYKRQSSKRLVDPRIARLGKTIKLESARTLFLKTYTSISTCLPTNLPTYLVLFPFAFSPNV